MTKIRNDNLTNYNSWFFFTILYLIIDYGRPEDVLPALGHLRPGLILILILTGYLVLSGKVREIYNSPQIKMIWLFTILLAVYVPFARNNYFAFITTKTMLLYMPFILSVVICVNSITRLKTLLFVCISLMIYISIYGFYHRGVGSGNYFHDENDLSLYIDMWLPFCYFLFISEKEKIKKGIYLSGLIIGILTVVVSFSRGGFIGLICMLAVVWLVSPRKILSLVAICLLCLVALNFGGQRYKNEMETVKNVHEGTAQARIWSWEAAWDMFLDNPLGVGGNNFPVRFPEYQPPGFRRSMWGRAAHSLWFTLIPELGIFGIIIYLSLLYYNLKDIFYLKNIRVDDNPDLQYIHALSLAFLASLAGFFASASFLSVLYYAHYWYLTGIIVATVKIAKDLEQGNV